VKQELENGKSTDEAGARGKNSQRSNIQELDEIEAVFETLYMPEGQPVWPASTGLDLRPINVAPQSLYAPRQHTNAANRKPWSLKKIHLNELAVDKLALRLLLHLDDLHMLKATAHKLPEDFSYAFMQPRSNLVGLLTETEQKLKQMRTVPSDSKHEDFDQHGSFFAKYHYNSEATAELNTHIKTLFWSYRQGEITHGDLLARLSWSMINWSTPPDVNCYNTILRGLVKTGVDHKATAIVIKAMRDGHIRMNESSLVSIFDHCRITDRRKMFMKYISLVRGMYNGLDLARPDINITEASQDRLLRVVDQVTGEEKVIQKPYPSPTVFGSLVKGVMHFCGLEAAMEVCQGMGHEGWGLSMKGMTPILMECANRGDWQSGNAVWEQIKLIQARSRRQGKTEKIMSTTLATMLHLCVVCERQDEFHNIFEQALAYSYPQKTILDELDKVNLKAVRRKPMKQRIDREDTRAGTVTDDSTESERISTTTASTSVALVEAEREDWHQLHDTEIYNINECLHIEADGISAGRYGQDESNTASSSAIRHAGSVSTANPELRPRNDAWPEGLHREQLWGSMAASHELEVYEEAERPMHLPL